VYCLVINSSNQKEYVHILNNSIVSQQNKRYILLAEQRQVIEEAREPLASVCILFMAGGSCLLLCLLSLRSDGAD
jgi:hypothetical protein